MSRSPSSWRVAGIAIGVVFSGLITGIQSASAAKTIDAVYAIRDYYQVVSLDPVTGSEHVVADFSSTHGFVRNLFADEHAPRLYSLVTYCVCLGRFGPFADRIATIDTADGSVRLSPVLAQITTAVTVFDPSTDNVWGMELCNTCLESAVVRIDPSTGAETTVTTLPVAFPSHTWLVHMAVVPKEHTLFVTFLTFHGFTASNDFRAIDMTTGATIASGVLAQPVGSLVYDAHSKILLAVTDAFPNELVRINMSTGAEATLATYAPGTAVYLGTPVPTSDEILALVWNFTPGTLQVAAVDDRTGVVSLGAALADTNTGTPVLERFRGGSDS